MSLSQVRKENRLYFLIHIIHSSCSSLDALGWPQKAGCCKHTSSYNKSTGHLPFYLNLSMSHKENKNPDHRILNEKKKKHYLSLKEDSKSLGKIRKRDSLLNSYRIQIFLK